MIPFFLLVVALLIFRGLGVLGVGLFANWPVAAQWALALMFLFTAASHFTRMRADLVRMVPGIFPRPELIVLATGVLEILGALGLLLPLTARLAALCLILLLLAMFPANVRAARERLPLRGRAATPLGLRTALQIVFIALLVLAMF